jgi:hypothetical protein
MVIMKTLRWVGVAVVVVALIGSHRPAGAQQPVPVRAVAPQPAPVQAAPPVAVTPGVPSQPAAVAPFVVSQPAPVAPFVVSTSFFIRVGNTYINSGRIDYVVVQDDTVEVYITDREDPVELRRRDVDASRLLQMIAPQPQ